MDGPAKNIAFIFPMMPGDLNPSLPVARELVSRGHHVHYLCFGQFKDAIEGTGAAFHSALEFESELYKGRTPDIFGAFGALKAEYLDADAGAYATRIKLNNVSVEKQLPGVLRFLDQVKADIVVYDTVVCREAAVAAAVRKLPAVALLAFAGPGGWEETVALKLKSERKEPAEFDEMAKTFQPNLEAIQRMNKTYSLSLKPGYSFGRLDPIPKLTLVTTVEDLKQPESRELVAAYEAVGALNEYLGPLLDQKGAVRAGTFKVGEAEEAKVEEEGPPIAELLLEAQTTKRPVIFVSMGTVTTGDDPTLGWNGQPKDEKGNPCGLTGRQLCQAAWAGVFDAFGSDSVDAGALILLTVGPQANPLGELRAPPNAFCRPFLPQVDILKAGCASFLTHGGQNSFMESLSQGTPMLVCPMAGDQFGNAKKAQEMGVGLDAGRPNPARGEEDSAMAAHRTAVAAKLKEVSAPEGPYAKAVKAVSQRLANAGGVSRAADLVMAAQ